MKWHGDRYVGSRPGYQAKRSKGAAVAVAFLVCVALAGIFVLAARPPVEVKVVGVAPADIESVRVALDSARPWRGAATVDVFDIIPTSGSGASRGTASIVLQVPLAARQCRAFAKILGGRCLKAPTWSSSVVPGDELPVASVEWKRPVDVRLAAESPTWIEFDSRQNGGPGADDDVSLSAGTRRLTVRFECDGANGASLFVSGGAWLQSDCTAANSRWVEVAVRVPRSALTVMMRAERFDLRANGSAAVVRPTRGGAPSLAVDGDLEEPRGAVTVRAANDSSVAVRLHSSRVEGQPVTPAGVSVSAQRATSAKVREKEHVTPLYVREKETLTSLIVMAFLGCMGWIWRRWIVSEWRQLRRRWTRTGGTS
jgi:hypothetical protein